MDILNKRLWKALQKDRLFLSELKRFDTQGYIKPSMWMPKAIKVYYTALYVGYKIGQGKAAEVKSIMEKA